MYRSKYFRRLDSDRELKLDSTISNGFILGSFCNESGHLWGGSSGYRLFVTKEDLEKEWKEFKFVVDQKSSAEVEQKVVNVFTKLLHQFNNYGLWEDAHDNTTTIEMECKIIKEAFFGEHKDIKAFGHSIDRSIKESFPEDFADELIFEDNHAFFMLMFELRDSVRELANLASGDKNG